MGYGGWDSVKYTSAKATRSAAGKSDFDYSDRIRSGAAKTAVHELLDPSRKAGDASPFAGKVMREVCITDEHPNPTAIAIVLDVTGSNYTQAVQVHAKLPQLFGVLQRTAGIEDPQVLIGATGDAYSDHVPLQMGQFESDNRIDAQVEAMYLEGNGGGRRHETYELAAYFLARHTHLEPWHKQGHKGYVFFIGDEMPYDTLRSEFDDGYLNKGHTVYSLIGDKLQADIPTAEVFEELKEQYEVFFLFQEQGAYRESDIMPPWRALLGENAVVLENPDNVCEFIAGLLAMREGGLDLDDVAGALTDAGFDKAAIASVSKTLAVVGAGSGGPVAKTDGSLSIDSGGADRL